MKIETNASNRKVLAQAISDEIGEPMRYLGVPSCAYQIGPYTVNRDASISGEDFGSLHAFLLRHDYIHEDEDTAPAEEVASMQDDSKAETDALETLADALDSVPSIDTISETIGGERITHTCVSIPITDYTPLAINCLLRMAYARQALINAMTQSDSIRIDEELIDRLNDEKPETVERIQEIVAEEIHADMVSGVNIADGKLEMTFPFDESKPTDWQAYAAVMLAMADRAKHARHVNAKKLEPTEEEMKYFCRNFLLQLGMGGAEHKEHRRVLLNHLSGFAAFRSADKMDAHKAKYAARRREARATEPAADTMKETEVDGDD